MVYKLQSAVTSVPGKRLPSAELHPEDRADFEARKQWVLAETPWLYAGFSLRQGYEEVPPPRPYRFTIEIYDGFMPDVWTGRIGYAISDRVKDLIEEMEPGRHRFWPVEVTDGTRDYPGYWLLNTCVDLDTIDRDRSNVHVDKIQEDDPRYHWLYPKFSVGDKDAFKAGITCRRELFAGHHLWCERMFDGYTFLSTEMRDRLTEMAVTGVWFQPMQDI